MDEGCRCSGTLVSTRFVLRDSMKGEDRCARHGGGKVSQTLLTQSLQATALAAPESWSSVVHKPQAPRCALRFGNSVEKTQLRGLHTWSSLIHLSFFPRVCREHWRWPEPRVPGDRAEAHPGLVGELLEC